MSRRIEFELSDEDHASILEASKPVPYLIIGGHEPASPQQNANYKWQALGARMGFDWTTVQRGRDERHFTAETLEVIEDDT